MDGEDIGVNQFGSTLQFGGGYPLNGFEKVYTIIPLAGWSCDLKLKSFYAIGK